jgi:uncharacterized membrane protein
LKEKEHIVHINRLTTQIQGHAQMVKESLQGQSNDLTQSRGGLGAMLGRIPVIDTFINRIWSRRRRDVIIMGVFIAILIIIAFFIWK